MDSLLSGASAGCYLVTWAEKAETLQEFGRSNENLMSNYSRTESLYFCKHHVLHLATAVIELRSQWLTLNFNYDDVADPESLSTNEWLLLA